MFMTVLLKFLLLGAILDRFKIESIQLEEIIILFYY